MRAFQNFLFRHCGRRHPGCVCIKDPTPRDWCCIRKITLEAPYKMQNCFKRWKTLTTKTIQFDKAFTGHKVESALSAFETITSTAPVCKTVQVFYTVVS